MPVKIRTLIIAIALLFQLTLISTAQDESGNDFRKTKWGMSVAQVKASESNLPTNEGPSPPFNLLIAYNGAIADMPVIYGFFFIDNKLVQGSYLFTQEHMNKNLYIKDYNEVKNILTRKYGEPHFDQTNWESNFYERVEENYGTAVSLGHLNYGAGWNTPTTRIMISLMGDNGKIHLNVIYYDKDAVSLIESKYNSEKEKDF